MQELAQVGRGLVEDEDEPGERETFGREVHLAVRRTKDAVSRLARQKRAEGSKAGRERTIISTPSRMSTPAPVGTAMQRTSSSPEAAPLSSASADVRAIALAASGSRRAPAQTEPSRVLMTSTSVLRVRARAASAGVGRRASKKPGARDDGKKDGWSRAAAVRAEAIGGVDSGVNGAAAWRCEAARSRWAIGCVGDEFESGGDRSGIWSAGNVEWDAPAADGMGKDALVAEEVGGCLALKEGGVAGEGVAAQSSLSQTDCDH